MQLNKLRTPLERELNAMNHLIRESLKSTVPLVNQIGEHLIHSGGKRLRPMLTLVSAKACGYTGEAHINMAVVIEFIHTATLLHDDVVDASDLRRGRQTANYIWGNEAPVLVGDFLYSRAFQMLVELGNMDIMRCIANATNTIAEGEVMQLINKQNNSLSQEHYLEVLRHKTAKLFQAASETGALLAQTSPARQAALAQFGMHLGTSYQLIDDMLDYTADALTMGKNPGDDLAEGKVTLPIIYSLKHATSTQREEIYHCLQTHTVESFKFMRNLIQNNGALEYTRGIAEQEKESAINCLLEIGDNSYRELLFDFANFSTARKS
jgi:octaprenyl-diphosphate synthase